MKDLKWRRMSKSGPSSPTLFQQVLLGFHVGRLQLLYFQPCGVWDQPALQAWDPVGSAQQGHQAQGSALGVSSGGPGFI